MEEDIENKYFGDLKRCIGSDYFRNLEIDQKLLEIGELIYPYVQGYVETHKSGFQGNIENIPGDITQMILESGGNVYEDNPKKALIYVMQNVGTYQ